MATIEERARNTYNSVAPNGVIIYHDNLIKCYIKGAKDQQKIDIKKACEAVCSFCQDKERCNADSYDPIECIRLAVSCEKIDKLVKAMEE